MNARAFVDSNILVYAHDSGMGNRHEKAKQLVEDLWHRRSGVISTQVLQEFYVNVRRVSKNPLSPAEARRFVEDYLCWEVIINDGDSILGALDLERRFGINFWDCLIVHAANHSGAETLYTEDLNHGQVYGNVEVTNPFV